MPKLSAICSSCGACANACPRGAITMQLDQEGFYKPAIDSDICSKCGTCERICPWLNDVVNPNDCSSTPKTIAAFAKNEEVRLASSSGGIFTVLAELILDEGGVVVGVAQLSPTHFGHVVVDNKIDLVKLRGSKYVQADAGLIYKQVRILLRDGRKVLFSGTPCQVAALYAVLGKNHFENLITVDIVCHGTPSVKVWQKYVEEIQSTEKSNVVQSYFRDKQLGWRKFSLKNVFSSREIRSNDLDHDRYMQIFLHNCALNKSCANCHYGKLPRIADITLGDYWNIADVHPDMDDDKGTSVVLLNTKRGENLFAQVSDQVVQCDSSLECAVAGNPCIVRSSKEHFRRYEFSADLDKLSMEELVKKYCVSLPLYKIVLLKFKKIFLDR
ncbi:MAG: Coenzyme F420 hydrogenase/dehydrogenase, beta subunit C-terminal domain [Fibrobacter sp.]|nr:Coenzyme F420 hydrogenase/dehydrogenase, beta subunit C-terminal domain [Fibrobacter sp.]